MKSKISSLIILQELSRVKRCYLKIDSMEEKGEKRLLANCNVESIDRKRNQETNIPNSESYI